MTKRMETNVASIEKWVFYFLCGFALFSSTSIAMGNVFLSLAIVAGAVRLWKKHDDIRELLTVDMSLAVPFLLFVAAAIFTSFFSTDMVKSFRVISDHYLYRMTGFYVVLMFIRHKKQLVQLLVLAFISHIINDAVCVYQAVSNGYIRTSGIIGSMMTGGSLDVWIPIIAVALMSGKLQGNKKYIFWFASIIAVGGLICNATRGTWLAMVVIIPLLMLLYMRSKLKALAAITVVMALVAGLFMSMPSFQHKMSSIGDTKMQSNAERLLLWQSAYNMFQDYPLTGVGYATFKKNYQEIYISPEAKEPYLGHAHNNFFHVLAECGFIGAACLLIWWLGTGIYCIKGWLRQRNLGYLALLGLFMGIMLQGLTEYTMGDSIVMKLFWFMLGLAYQWIHVCTEEIDR